MELWNCVSGITTKREGKGGERMDFISPVSKNGNSNSNREFKAAKKIRATRCDKLHPIKFPVDPMQTMKLRRYKELANRIHNLSGNEKLEQAEFNNALIKFGLKNLNIIDWKMEYQDTKKYMYTKLLETEYSSVIGGPYGLSIQKGVSDRKLVYLIIFSVVTWLERGGNLEEII
jgi:hypothetical protein